ncbi:hypothetical protein [Frateuria sp. GZRR33]|uniref:hypothetical protein n=1 Tax=Frateuria sp. GZRR33 TaxID=3351535 RepID=UPI003F738ECA
MTGIPRNPASLRQMHGALTAVPPLYQCLAAVRNTSNTNGSRGSAPTVTTCKRRPERLPRTVLRKALREGKKKAARERATLEKKR